MSEVSGLLPRPAAEPETLAADRSRRGLGPATWVLAGVVALVLAGVGVALRADRPEERGLLVTTESGPTSATTSPLPAAEADEPWLAAPWTLTSATSTTWAGGEPGGYAFCDLRPYVPVAPMSVDEQRFVHPDGRRALLLRVASAEGASQVWKWSYAECRVAGRAESVGGPRNLWSHGAVAAGAQLVGPYAGTAEAATRSQMYLLELTGPSLQRPATRAEVSELMDRWVGTGAE